MMIEVNDALESGNGTSVVSLDTSSHSRSTHSPHRQHSGSTLLVEREGESDSEGLHAEAEEATTIRMVDDHHHQLPHHSKHEMVVGVGGGGQSPLFSDRSKPHVLEWNIERLDVKGKKGATRTLIQGVAGRTQSGEFTAILGPSGAGKTTLIECLSLRNRNFEGALHLDGKSPGPNYFTSAALVHQKELLFGFLTVREHLQFHAVTRMSKHCPKAEVEARIEAVMKEIQLDKCADTMIGGTDPLCVRKGLSGGERKRLVIATELLLCPALIFLDEPTSGLDSVMAESVIYLLKDLAQRGVTVMTSIHSPSSEMVGLFSHLILLTSDGTLAFHGRMADAVPHFEALGHTLPKGYAATDFFLRLVSRSSLRSAEEQDARLQAVVTAWKASPRNTYSDKTPLPAENYHRTFTGVQGHHVSWLQLFTLNVWRGSLQMRRDYVTLGAYGAAMATLGLIFGLLYYDQALASWRNLMGMLFAAVTSMFIASMFGTMTRFPLEWSIVMREYMSGSNAMGPYVAAKVVYESASVYAPILLATILYWMSGLQRDGWLFLRFVLSVVLIDRSSVYTGFFVSSFSPNPLLGLSILPVVMAPMIMFSGLLYQKSAIPPYLAWIQYGSIVNYGFASLVGLTLEGLPQASQRLILTFTEIDPSAQSTDMLMMVAIAAAAVFLAYVTLKIRIKMMSSSI